MASSSPLRSYVIDRGLLKDHETRRLRPPDKKPFALITTKRHPTLPLAIHNYNNRAFMGSTLDELAVAARTLITETTTGNVISRSFSKFFNHDEKFAYKPTCNEYAFSIEEKIDGSIISLFYYASTWIMVSRSSFEGPHIQAARSILDSQYPKVLEILGKDKTYIFELIEPTMAIKIMYPTRDLVLLSIVSKDGQEPPNDFDWTIYPFPRPRIHSASEVRPTLLRTLNLENEEGFVIKFWQSPEDRYPQRIKVKFESYLRSTSNPKEASTSSRPLFLPSVPLPPSSAKILDTYINGRLNIHHFKADLLSVKMRQHKDNYVRSLESIADDYGGEDWLTKIEKLWNRIDALVSVQEAEWIEDTASLRQEGYKPGAANANSNVAKKGFEKRIKRFETAYCAALMAWFAGEPLSKQVSLVVKNMTIPEDLRSPEIILCDSS